MLEFVKGLRMWAGGNAVSDIEAPAPERPACTSKSAYMLILTDQKRLVQSRCEPIECRNVRGPPTHRISGVILFWGTIGTYDLQVMSVTGGRGLPSLHDRGRRRVGSGGGRERCPRFDRAS